MIQAADLFCGAGGTSQGLAQACERLSLGTPSLVAINHNTLAVKAHRANHPWARHYCARVESLEPRELVPGGKLDIIVAGVECTHHSQARGGRPMCDQSRASAWHVLHWAEKLHVRDILIENVPEFLNWGPIGDDGRPIRAKRGETFQAFVNALDSLDYRVDWRVLTCADYGDPTTRRRFFLRARLGGGAIEWPDQTHAEDHDELPGWRPAREIIDWSDLGTSIFRRKRPLAPRTIERIAEGVRRYCGEYAEPFLVMLYGTGTVRGIDRPLPTVTARGGHIGLARPFILPHDQFPKRNQLSLVDSVDRPMRTIGAHNGGDNYLCAPFLVPNFGERPGQRPRTHSVDGPVPTVTATKGAGNLCTPFLFSYYGNSTYNDAQKPLGTVTTKDRFALVTPDGHALDIFFRMLQPRELARAQGFPEGYVFMGNKGDVVRQIGNAVPVKTAAALCHAALRRGAA